MVAASASAGFDLARFNIPGELSSAVTFPCVRRSAPSSVVSRSINHRANVARTSASHRPTPHDDRPPRARPLAPTRRRVPSSPLSKHAPTHRRTDRARDLARHDAGPRRHVQHAVPRDRSRRLEHGFGPRLEDAVDQDVIVISRLRVAEFERRGRRVGGHDAGDVTRARANGRGARAKEASEESHEVRDWLELRFFVDAGRDGTGRRTRAFIPRAVVGSRARASDR